MIGWFDAGSGASGDMMLGALIGAGADEEAIRDAVQAIAPEHVELSSRQVRRGAIVATQAVVQVAESHTHRGLSDVVRLIDDARLSHAVTEHAEAVFELLAAAEATVHGVSVDEVHFHEVGALDAIVDVVGVSAGLVELGLDRIACSTVAVGSGTVSTAHGLLTVPPPAVVQLLLGVPTQAGPGSRELCTPTGAALLRHWVDEWTPQPAMAVRRVGVGAGGHDAESHANVLRLLVGEPPRAADAPARTATLLETNVDDLDPRLWPGVLARLLGAGASDAWLTPILMKKGRPAHTLSVLAPTDLAATLRRIVFEETSAIGCRESVVGKHELDRQVATVDVRGQRVRVKLALADGMIVNRQPEYEDVAAVARATRLPAKTILAEALSAATMPTDPPEPT